MMVMVGMSVAIGAAFRRKRLDHQFGFGAKAVEHLLDDMVAADQDAVLADLGFQMPVAQVPRQHQHVMGIPGSHRHKRLRLGSHTDNAPVLQHQPVTVGKLHCPWKVEQKRHSLVGR